MLQIWLAKNAKAREGWGTYKYNFGMFRKFMKIKRNLQQKRRQKCAKIEHPQKSGTPILPWIVMDSS